MQLEELILTTNQALSLDDRGLRRMARGAAAHGIDEEEAFRRLKRQRDKTYRGWHRLFPETFPVVRDEGPNPSGKIFPRLLSYL